ncbi:MAG: glucose-1-phosphate cytidylyltransferase [Acidobacteriota bacterium]
MKAVILAGGLGTRLQEETSVKPKPMVEIGGRPILWHIMSIYAAGGIREFAVALGHKGDLIKRYFLDYYSLRGDLTVDLNTGAVRAHDATREDWQVHLIDTGAATDTGGRLKRLAPLLADGTFMMTYGDGVARIDVGRLLAFHRSHGRLATVTAVRPPSRFGGMGLEGDAVATFAEKPQIAEGWINGGFFVLESEVLDYIDGDQTIFERGPLERLAADGQLMAYRHTEFWQCMDTMRELRLLESLWESGSAPWRIWE